MALYPKRDASLLGNWAIKLLKMYSRVHDLENIYLAYLKARKCKRYRSEVLKYTKSLEKQL